MALTPDQRTRFLNRLSFWRDVLAVGTLVIYGLYAGSGFVIPIAVAFLVFVLITAVSDRVSSIDILGRHPPAWVSYLTGIAAVLSGVFAIMFILGTQATAFARAMPLYEAKMDLALRRLANLVGTRLTDTLHESFVQIDMSVLAVSAFGGASSFLSSFLLITLYVGFMLAERTVFNRKIEVAAGDEKFGRDIRQVMDAVSLSMQRYVGVKSFVSALTSLISYSIFRWMELEFAETWAVLTFALNFIPSIGSVVAVVFPAIVSLIQFETLTPFLVIIFGCGTIQFLIGNLLDPALTGRSINLSTLTVMLALTFWTAIWGVTGAFLSVPLTVCIVILFSHLPGTRPLAILMSVDGHLVNDDEWRANQAATTQRS